MIIDLILDRKDGLQYEPKRFYNEVTQYGEVGYQIAEALDNGTELAIKMELGKYIKNNGYNEGLIKYIFSVNWL